MRRIAVAASRAAWLLPTIMYLLCMALSIVLIQPDRLVGSAAPFQFARERDGASEMLDGDIGAGKTADKADGRNGFSGLVESAQCLLIDGAAIPAKAHRAIDDANTIDFGECGHHRLQRERPKGLDLDEADGFAFIAGYVDRIRGRAGHAADSDKRIVGVVEPIFLDQRRVIAAKPFAPAGMHLADDPECILHAADLAFAITHEVAGAGTASTAGQRIDSHRPQWIERNVPVGGRRTEEFI